jgi:3'-5' exoribonuclease
MTNENKTFVREIKEGQPVDSIFLVVNKELRPRKTDGQYLRLILADKTGEIYCNMWDNFQKTFATFQIDDYVRIRGHAKMYQQKLQLSLTDLQKVDSSEVNIKDFQKTSKRSPDEMWKELNEFASSIENRYLKQLIKNIFQDEEVKNLFSAAPAAKALHHSYNGGLLEHTLSVANLCNFIAEHYKTVKVNRDLLLSGALLHDFGKIFELSFDRNYNYTDEGRLIGHITIEAIRLQKEIDKIPDFPKELALQLIHMILAHHGSYEFGSPKRPKTIEAMILYYLDDMDAKIEAMFKFITENAAEGRWAGYEQKQFDRFIYKGSLFEGQDPGAEE